MSHKIVFLDRETLDANLRKPNFPHEYTEYAQTAPSEVVLRLKGADICITNKVPLREDTLKQLPDLKLIAVAATGTDVIDKAYTTAHGITVSNIRNYAFDTLPEHVFALLFALRRNLVNYHNSVFHGRWATIADSALSITRFMTSPVRRSASSVTARSARRSSGARSRSA